MHDLKATDDGLEINWGNVSQDYAVYRPGPPVSFYKKLHALGIGLDGQNILDLGTGTGVLARHFASLGARVCGADISDGQIEAAKALALEQGLKIDFRVSPAESTPFPSHSFDVITANQCFLYFDRKKIIKEIDRLLAPGGVLVTSHFSWLPRLDPIAKVTEELVLQYNSKWSANDWHGNIPPVPYGLEDDFILKGMFFYDEAIPFTIGSWCGRMRACRGLGVVLSDEKVKAFERNLKRVLCKIKGIKNSEFTVLHRLDAHILQPK